MHRQKATTMSYAKVIIQSILYFFGLESNPIEKTEHTRQSDHDAIKSDWCKIGMDFRNAMNRYEVEQAQREIKK